MLSHQNFQVVELRVVCNEALIPLRAESKLWTTVGKKEEEELTLTLSDNAGPRAFCLLILAARLARKFKLSTVDQNPALFGNLNTPASSLFNAVASYKKEKTTWFNILFGGPIIFDRFLQSSLDSLALDPKDGIYKICWNIQSKCKLIATKERYFGSRIELSDPEILEACRKLVAKTQTIEIKVSPKAKDGKKEMTWAGYTFPTPVELPANAADYYQEEKSLTITVQSTGQETREVSGALNEKPLRLGDRIAFTAKVDAPWFYLHWITISLGPNECRSCIYKIFPDPDEDFPPDPETDDASISYELELECTPRSLTIPTDYGYGIENQCGFEVCILMDSDQSLTKLEMDSYKATLLKAAQRISWPSPDTERIGSTLTAPTASVVTPLDNRVIRPRPHSALALMAKRIFRDSVGLQECRIDLMILPVTTSHL